MIIRSIQSKYKQKYGKDDFWKQETEYVIWCRELLSKGSRYDFSTEDEYPEVQRNSFYCKARNGLNGIRFSNEELQTLINQHPNDATLKVIYIEKSNTRKDALKKKNQVELATICRYCEDLLCDLPYPKDSLLWKWFNAYILADDFDCSYALGIVSSLPDIKDNLTANYLLYILYFCRFCHTGSKEDASRAQYCLDNCKNLCLNNPQRVSSKFFLIESNRTLLTTDRAQASKYPCTIVDEVTQEQSAKMIFDRDSRFKVFFVPFYNKVVRPGQGFNLPVNAVIGFSYSGLRGFDLELRKSESAED